MTDSEIIKALEVCTTAGASCKNCPAYVKVDRSNCKEAFRGVLDLINRQKADIEELKYKVKKWKENYESSQVVVGDFREIINEQAEKLKTAKAEAIKEFADRLKEKIDCDVHTSEGFYFMVSNAINSLVKEMVGE